MRLHAHPTRRHRARRVAAAVLSLPVFAQVYLGSASRMGIGHPRALVATLLVAGIVASQLGGRLVLATPSPSLRPLAATAFQPVVVPSPPGDAGLSVTDDAPSRGSLVRRPPSSPDPPAVVRFRPRPGQTAISRFAAVSVRFTQPMDRATTQPAFTATVAGKRVRGDYVWAEGGTVLVLIPSHPLPYGARVQLAVSAAARSKGGTALEAPRSATFAVVARPASTVKPAASTAATLPTRRASVWQWPLIGPITQYFGQHLTKYGFHQGIDINGDTGDPVVAARSGRVVVAGYADSCGGLQVRIDHGNGLLSWYRHLSRVHVRIGARLAAGTLIGRVGSTGCSFGSHLHFGISRHGTFVDPLRYLPRR